MTKVVYLIAAVAILAFTACADSFAPYSSTSQFGSNLGVRDSHSRPGVSHFSPGIVEHVVERFHAGPPPSGGGGSTYGYPPPPSGGGIFPPPVSGGAGGPSGGTGDSHNSGGAPTQAHVTTPEPASLAELGLCFGALAAIIRRRLGKRA